MKIERIPLDKIEPYKNNAKLHPEEQIEQIKDSIQEFGFNDPIAVDENNVIIEGHGRFFALQELGYKEAECIRLTHMTDEQKRAYILVHNKLTMNTGFDMELLESELKNITAIDMEQFDFDCDFSVSMDMTFTDDDVGKSPDKDTIIPRIRPGEVWQLGEHRLMCGDSTCEADVDRLTNGDEMDMCLTDPPYNVNYEGGTDEHMTIINDNMDDASFHDFLSAFYSQMMRVLKPGGAFYIFHADSEGLNFRSALHEAGGAVRETLIWVKNALVLGRQDYQWKHEPCLYGWKDGAGHYFIDDRCQTTVFDSAPDLDEMDRDQLLAFTRALLDAQMATVIREKKPTVNDLHPTMKPVPLCARLVKNSTRRGEKVIDFFGGSGSTLMACQELKRVCYIMELDPQYAEVIIQRWEDETGEKAVKISGAG